MNHKLQYLKNQLQARQKRRAEFFQAYACHNDKNATARRALAGNAGNWYTLESGDRVYFVEQLSPHWRNLGDVHDICRNSHEISSRLVDHTGWYCDSFQDALCIGGVAQLPARKGSPQYVPYTRNTDSDGITLYLHDICDELRDAVIFADGLAEREAENEREYHARDLAEQDIERHRDEIAGARRACRALLREMKPARKAGIDSPAICAALRARVAGYLEDIRAARERIAALQDNFWLSVQEV